MQKKKFFNPEFQAYDILKFRFPISLYDEIKLKIHSYGIEKLWRKSPKWNSDICWLSANSINEFNLFNEIFISLNIQAQLNHALNLGININLYCGFLVKRSTCHDVNFHTDWAGTGLNAFTLITPLVEASNDLGLSYIRSDSSFGTYLYKPGEAIIFAEEFIHSSMPMKRGREVLLLSFTFGTDDMSLWPMIAKSAQSQSNFIRLPNGDFRVKELGKFVCEE